MPRRKGGTPRQSGTGRGTPATSGAKLRAVRRSRGLTLQEVAAGTDLSASFLSLVETGKSDITLAKLQRVVQFYNITIGSLLEEPSEDEIVTRADSRRPMHSPGEGVRTELAVPKIAKRQLEALIMSFEPGAEYAGSLTHVGEEVIFIVEGELELVLNETDVYLLAAGDTACYSSAVPHRFRNTSTGVSRLFGVVTPATL